MLILISNVRRPFVFVRLNYFDGLNRLGDKGKTEFCDVTLTPSDYDAFLYGIKNHYWYQMFIDDLPIWGLFVKILGMNHFVFVCC